MARYCLTGSRMGHDLSEGFAPVLFAFGSDRKRIRHALPPYGQWVQGQISLSTALQAGLELHAKLEFKESAQPRRHGFWIRKYQSGVAGEAV